MNYLIIILITFISGVVGTGLGGVVGAVMKRDSNKIVSLLLSFAAGIMLAVVCFDLMSEPLHMMEEGTLPSLTPLIIVASVAAGYGIVYLLNFLIDKRTNREVKHIDENHPATADDLDGRAYPLEPLRNAQGRKVKSVYCRACDDVRDSFAQPARRYGNRRVLCA